MPNPIGSQKSLRIALVGNPNCGKTTLFNVLTGTWQRVGNWAGVTVERKTGFISIENHLIEIVDLPGTYTLTNIDPECPLDEKLTREFLKSSQYSCVLNVIDASNLERNLYLTLQCLEQNIPVIVALNRIDLSLKQGTKLCVQRLAADLGCPVVPIIARQCLGIEELKILLTRPLKPTVHMNIPYHGVLEEHIVQIEQAGAAHNIPRFQIIRWLEGESVACNFLLADQIARAQRSILAQTGFNADVLIAQARYEFIERIVAQVKQSCALPRSQNESWTEKIDQIVCHRYLGLPVFLAVMYGLFFFAINFGGAFQDFFEISSRAFFVESLAQGLHQLKAPAWLMALLVSGVGNGVSTILTFVPVLGAMFFALAFLEDCGYMARAAFVMDRLMQSVGLPGKSFVPMIVGFGCNVPAIMGTRTLDNKRDRILAVMMSPFMSCGARLAIFTVFVAAFFPSGGQNIVFLLYLIGIVMAVLTGLLLKRTLLKGNVTPLLLEIPNYQWPHWPSLVLYSWHRLKRFIINAGKLIVPVCVCVGGLNSVSVEGKWSQDLGRDSLLAVMGQKLVPVFKPLGIEEENWPAAVGLLAGILAKEVVIGTLNSLYTESKIRDPVSESFDLGLRLHEARASLFENLFALGGAGKNVVASKTHDSTLPHHVYGEMVKRFNGRANAFAYLLFVLLYFPCVSATAAMVREVQRKWTLFSICWTTGLAYAIAVLYYQCATFIEHPLQSSVWMSILLGTGLAVFMTISHYKNLFPKLLPTPIVLNKG